MPYICAVKGCDHVGISGLVKLPADDQISQLILRQLGFEECFEPTVSFRVCIKHFTPESLKKSGKGFALTANPKLVEPEDVVVTAELLEKMEIEDDTIRGFMHFKAHMPDETCQLLRANGWDFRVPAELNDSPIHL